MTNNIVDLFMCVSAIRVSSLEEYRFKPLVHFMVGLFAFLLWMCNSSLYILNASLLSDLVFANIFSHSVN